MKNAPILAIILAPIFLGLPGCYTQEEESHGEHHTTIVATSPLARDVVITQPYVCQIRSQINTEIRALDEGFLEQVAIKEGQAVKQGDVLFTIYPPLYKARLEAEKAELQYAKVKYETTKNLYDQKVVSVNDLNLHQAELVKAEAKLQLAEAEYSFATVRAPFDGIVDRQNMQKGALIKKEDLLTTLSDNSVMRAYFNVPEARYYEYMSGLGDKNNIGQIELPESRIELVLANQRTYDYSPGNVVTIEGLFDNTTGNISFRADFPNPKRLLRHGQTGTVLIHHTQHNAIIIPQRATFEILDKQYVWVIGEDHVVHQHPITVLHELEDIFVIKSDLNVKDKIVLEGVREVHNEEKLEEYEFRKPEEAMKNQKFHAE